MRSCLWKLEPGFWTYGWIHLLGPSGLNVLSRSQAPSSRNFLKFHDFIGFISSFLRKWGLVCENSSQGSGLMAGYFFWVQVAQINVRFLGSRSQVKIVFEISWFYWIHLIIYEKMRSCLWKLEPGFWTYAIMAGYVFWANGPNIVFRPQQVPRSRHFLRFYDFIVFTSSFLRKWVSVCENWSQGSGLMAGYIFWAQ